MKLGEADAAVVYRSDVAADGAATGVPIREPFNTSLRYPIITLAEDAATAEFVTYALSAEGLATVQSFGSGRRDLSTASGTTRRRMPLGGVPGSPSASCGLGLALLVLPLLALLLRADWSRLAADLAHPTALLALRLSVGQPPPGGPLPPARDAARLAPRPERPPGGAMGAGAGHCAAGAAPVVGGVALLMTWAGMAWSAST